jgi:hypothetical protein
MHSLWIPTKEANPIAEDALISYLLAMSYPELSYASLTIRVSLFPWC